MQRRVNGPRSRSGCITCKFRHVKCDETKPACQQCERTGRKCDGYDNDNASQAQLRRRLHSSYSSEYSRTGTGNVTADNVLTLRPETRTERRYVEYFFTHTARAFAGFFDSKLWAYLVPQLSEREPSIRHAVVAVGALHSRVTRVSGEKHEADGMDTFVLHEYNTSIRHLMQHFPPNTTYNNNNNKNNTETLTLTLTTCCLFICLEILRQNKNQALAHIRAGVEILQAQNYNHHSQNHSFNDLLTELLDLFTRWNITASLFGQEFRTLRFPAWDVRSRHRHEFADMVEARLRLHQVMSDALFFVRSVGVHRQRFEPEVEQVLLTKQAGAQVELGEWRCGLERLEQRLNGNISSVDVRAGLLLRIYYQTAMIWVDTVLLRDERCFDGFMDEFATIIHEAEEVVQLTALIDHQRSTTTSTSSSSTASDGDCNTGFTLEGEIIAPLYYAAMKCRDPRVRRRALAVLDGYAKEEGLWTARRYAAVATLVCEIEEGIEVHPGIEGHSVVQNAGDIPDQCRVYDTVQLDPVAANPCQVVTLSKPRGVDGVWEQTIHWVHY